MQISEQRTGPCSLSLVSSVSDGDWLCNRHPGALQWWYFDALSSGGRNAVIIRFADSSGFSENYLAGSRETRNNIRFPAVSFTYLHEGTIICRTVNESSESDFITVDGKRGYSVGPSYFYFETVEYGSRFRVEIHSKLSRGRSVEASFEWLIVESDIFDNARLEPEAEHIWNLAAPRADVSGKIVVTYRDRKNVDTFHFRGSGYHDQAFSPYHFGSNVRSLHRGRVHFADSTAIFHTYHNFVSTEPVSTLVIVREKCTLQEAADYDIQEYNRTRYGARYPSRIRIQAGDSIRLRVKPFKIIDSTRNGQQLLTEMTLTLRDGIPRRSIGLTEFICPTVSGFRLLKWLGKH